MARTYNQQTIAILETVLQNPVICTRELYKTLAIKQPYKDFYNNIYRLVEQGFLERKENNKGIVLVLSEEGQKILGRIKPQRDG
ncbi:MAG: hypothetical protein M1400_02825, partial [Patescibacteria group bacterium]|nr:hypothetical protein [Patescibacteria group bacterium]